MQNIDWTKCLYSFYSPVYFVRFNTISSLWRRCSAKMQNVQVSLKKDDFKNFTKLTGKHLCHSQLLNKVGGWELQLYLKRDSDTFVFLWDTFLQNTSRELLLKMDILQDSCFTEYQSDCMIKIFEKYQWGSWILVVTGL